MMRIELMSCRYIFWSLRRGSKKKSDLGKVVLIALEAVLVESKPPMAARVRISEGERYGLDAAAPLSTRASFLEQGRAGCPVESSPKLVRRIGSVSTCAEELYPLITRSAAAAPSVRLRVLVYVRCVCLCSKTGLPRLLLKAC